MPHCVLKPKLKFIADCIIFTPKYFQHGGHLKAAWNFWINICGDCLGMSKLDAVHLDVVKHIKAIILL